MMPTLASMYAEHWAMRYENLVALFELLHAAEWPTDPAAFMPTESATGKPKDLNIIDGVAHIPIQGTIMKTAPWWASFFGVPVASTTAISDQLVRAIEDPRVKSIMLDIESPGGAVKGVAELAADVGAAASLKPVNAHVTDLCASAAYWIASQANGISANAMGTIGSIGVYSVVQDSSQRAERLGIKVHVVSTHALKGAGVEGAPITDAQLADMQRIVDQYGQMFVDAVAGGRKQDTAKVRESATGQVWLASESLARGLIDAVMPADVSHRNTASGMPLKAEEITAPTLGATTERDSMDEKAKEAERVAQLERDKAAAEAEAKALKAQMAAIDEERVDALMATHRDRIAPTASADMKEALLKMPKEKREPFLQSLAPVTRKDPESKKQPESGTTPDATALEGGELFVAKQGGLSEERTKLLSQIVGFRSDGSYDLADGRTISRDEAKKMGIVSA